MGTSESTSDPRFFAQTGYRIADDGFWNYFSHRGGVRTFGYPVSRRFVLEGFPVQVFQRAVLQQAADGSVRPLNLLDPDGTRAEVMELHAIGKPCCSPFTASDPEK